MPYVSTCYESYKNRNFYQKFDFQLPVFETGSLAWKASILTTRLQLSLPNHNKYFSIYIIMLLKILNAFLLNSVKTKNPEFSCCCTFGRSFC